MLKSTKKQLLIIFILCLLLGVLTFLFTPFALANEHNAVFKSLVPLPGFDPGSPDIGQFIQALYSLAIIIGALLAVIKIILAGFKYMFGGTVTTTEDAKADIKGALLGLLIIVGAVVILGTINPQLTNLNIFGRAEKHQEKRDKDLEKIKDNLEEFCGAENNPESWPCDRISCIRAANAAVSCAQWCDWVVGMRIGNSTGSVNSGSCMYLDDPEKIAAANTAAKKAMFKYWVEQERPAFQKFPNPPKAYLKQHFKKLKSGFLLESEDEIKGYFEVNTLDPKRVERGLSDFYNDPVYKEKAKEACEAKGGSRVAILHRINFEVAGHIVVYCME